MNPGVHHALTRWKPRFTSFQPGSGQGKAGFAWFGGWLIFRVNLDKRLGLGVDAGQEGPAGGDQGGAVPGQVAAFD